MEKRIIDLEIIDELEGSGVDAIALVDSPAIEKNFMYFKVEEFVEPQSGESESDYMGRCVPVLIGEGKDSDQAVAICISTYQNMALVDNIITCDSCGHSWDVADGGEDVYVCHECGHDNQMDFAKVSFDWDDTLSTARGKKLFEEYKKHGDQLYIITARSTPGADIFQYANKMGILPNRIFATGSNKAKIEKVKELKITKHIDNNPSVVASLFGIGEKFEINTGGLAPYTNQNGPLKRKAVALHKMLFADEDKKEIVAIAMVPDMEIPRKDKDGNIYFVRFSKEVIAKIAEKYMREQRLADTNIQHVDSADAGAYVFESWITETADDKANSVYGLDAPIGAWCVKMRVTNLETWAKVKSGELKGLSIQGDFLDKNEYDAYIKDKKMYSDLVKLVSTL